MSNLNENWKPMFGTIYTWFAIDKNGQIAVMINNCWGDIPKSILRISDAESLLDDMNEYMWEESDKYKTYPEDKHGELIVDLFSYWRNNQQRNNREITNDLRSDLHEYKHYSDANLSANKGFFVYEAVEGYN